MSQITTHILDTSRGEPAVDVTIFLYQYQNNEWEAIGGGATNDDGRLPDMVGDDVSLQEGTYKLKFATEEYYEGLGINTFFPYVEVIFYLMPGENYHIPLLLSPYGYSTYRGS